MRTLLALLVTPFTMALNGWVLSVLWRWFVVPPFGLPELGVLDAIGVSLVVHYLTHQHSPQDGDDDMAWVIALAIVVPLWALAVGWIVHSLDAEFLLGAWLL